MTQCPNAVADPGAPGDPRPQNATPVLVDARWLASHLDDPDVVPVEVDAEGATYYRGHVPGAVTLDWLDDLHHPRRRRFLDQQRFEALMDAQGIGADDHVVLYGDAENTYAAYAHWVFRYYRHRRVSLLDGGRAGWLAAGGPLTAQPGARRPRSGYRSPGPDPEIRATRDLVLARYVGARGGAVLVDCRSPAEYAGWPENPLDLPLEHHRVPGHIPGAHNVPHPQVLAADGTFRSPAELGEMFGRLGVSPGSDVAVYCRVGERSSLLWFALHELVGHPRVRNYEGGWAEYGSLVDAPIADDGEPAGVVEPPDRADDAGGDGRGRSAAAQ